VVGQQHRVLFTNRVGHLLRYPLVLTGRNVARVQLICPPMI
jgi:hypothetical protein